MDSEMRESRLEEKEEKSSEPWRRTRVAATLLLTHDWISVARE